MDFEVLWFMGKWFIYGEELSAPGDSASKWWALANVKFAFSLFVGKKKFYELKELVFWNTEWPFVVDKG